MLYRKIAYGIICLAFFSCNLFSQASYIPEYGDPMEEPWRWTIFDELSGKGVRCAAESDGNMWFGINNGIIGYNGLEWKEYTSENGFPGNTVYHLTGSNNKIYAGTDQGLFLFKNEKWEKIFPVGNHPENDRLQKINCLKTLRNGGIIASIGSGDYSGLLSLVGNDKKLMVSKKTADSIRIIKGIDLVIVPGDKCIKNIFFVEEVFQDSQNRIWVWVSQGTDEGNVFYFTLPAGNNSAVAYSKNFNSTDGLIKGIRARYGEDKHGNIWMVNNEFNKGVSIFNGTNWNYTKSKGENSHLSISTINSTIWIGGFGLLYTFDNGKWKKYQKPVTQIPEAYISVYKDTRGCLWIIGTQNKVIRIDYFNNKWTSYRSLNFQCEDKSNNLWFLSVDGKVVLKKENSWFSYNTEDGLPDAPVKIYCTKKGLICVAGSYHEQASISFLINQKWERHVYPELSWGVDYRAVYEDADENLWIGASVNFNRRKRQKSGIIKIMNPGTKEQKETHYLPGQDILRQTYGIAQTKDGVIWIAGSNLNYFSNDQWHHFTDIQELTTYSNCLGTTPNGELWVGSRMHGVFWFNGREWQNFNIENGLRSNTIISLFPVDEQDIWIATDNDFSRYDGKGWTTGLLPGQFTLSREGGDIQIQADGTLWINKSTRDWKRRALNNNLVEKEDIEYFSTFAYKGDTLKPDTKISLYPNEIPSTGNTIIEWTGSDKWQSVQKLKLQYSYRLNEGEWSEFSYKNSITFFHLKNGEYNFEVKARDADFNIDPTPDSVTFIVLPPVWKQGWFIVLILFFLIIIIAYQANAYRRKRYLEKLNKQLEEHSNEIERKNALLEEQKDQILHQNNLERERNLGKIRFFTNISHEFRTPLTLITGIIDSITEDVVKKNPSFFQGQFATIKRNADQLLRLINQLMDFRKLDNNSMVLRVSESNIVSFINDICFSFKDFAKKHGIKLVFKSDYKKHTGWFDNDIIEKALYNLLSNAIKFTPEGGSISIHLKPVVIKNTEYTEITIEDTGIGISDDEIKKIFIPFYQVKKNNGRKDEGTGIGLSIVNNLVNLHHGKMKVISTNDIKLQTERGFSTRFTITLSLNRSTYNDNEIFQQAELPPSIEGSVYIDDPVDEEYIHESLKDLDLPDNRAVPLIVVVEDHDDLRRFIVNSLNKYYKVLEATNGSDGFDLSVKYMPDMLISDIMMPQMSGTELCQKIKNDIRTSHIPVILLTARTTDENKIEGFQIGADDYITKPFNIPLLITRINNLLDTHLILRRKYKNEGFIEPDQVHVSSMDAEFLNKVKTIVEQNYHNQEFGVKELSNEVGISTRHILFKLQNLIDVTPSEYIRVFRLKRASQLIKSKKATISEIAFETGFNDVSNFSKAFTKYFNMNPSQYSKTYYKK